MSLKIWVSGNDKSSQRALRSGLHTMSAAITLLPKWYFTEVVMVVQPLEQMILYQHDKVNCLCSWPSSPKPDCDGLKPLCADSTTSGLRGVCKLNHSSSHKQFFSSAERSQSNSEEQMYLREGAMRGTAGHERSNGCTTPSPWLPHHWSAESQLPPAREAPRRGATRVSSQPPWLGMFQLAKLRGDCWRLTAAH